MGDTGTAKSKVKTDYQRLARSTIGTQLLSLASPKTQSKSWWDPSQWVGSRCIGSLVQRNNHHILKLSLIIVWIFGSSQIFALFSSLKCDLHQSINLLTLFTFYVFTLSLRKKKKVWDTNAAVSELRADHRLSWPGCHCGTRDLVFLQQSSDGRRLLLGAKVRCQHVIFPQETSQTAQPPIHTAERWGSLKGPLPHTLLSPLFPNSNQRKDYVLLSQPGFKCNKEN